jgi:hypothetical protein
LKLLDPLGGLTDAAFGAETKGQAAGSFFRISGISV